MPGRAGHRLIGYVVGTLVGESGNHAADEKMPLGPAVNRETMQPLNREDMPPLTACAEAVWSWDQADGGSDSSRRCPWGDGA